MGKHKCTHIVWLSMYFHPINQCHVIFYKKINPITSWPKWGLTKNEKVELFKEGDQINMWDMNFINNARWSEVENVIATSENGDDCVVVEVVDLEEANICLSIEIFRSVIVRSSDFWIENDFYFPIYLRNSFWFSAILKPMLLMMMKLKLRNC